MKYLPLLWANLRRKRVRTLLTFLSVVVAFLLFGLLEAVSYALTGGAELAGQDRLVTQHRVSLIQYLPKSYLDRIRALEGVKVATSQDWFGGIYRDERNQITATAVDPDTFFEVYPEFAVSPEQMQAWHSTRTATIVGRDVAERFGWKVGDKVPLRSNIFRKRDGSDTWDLDIVGIYSVENGDNTNLFLQYDYLNEARTYGRDEVGWIILRIDDPNRAEAIETTIDTLFANSSTETRTTTESAFLQGFANQMGNIGRIVTIVAAAVFFTMLLVTANAMAQSVRERVRDIAVMRTLGFSNGSIVTLVLVEGLVITVLGSVVGLWFGNALAKSVGKQMQQFLPLMMTPPNSYLVGLILAVGLGVLSCAIPCLQVSRLEVVDQLRRA